MSNIIDRGPLTVILLIAICLVVVGIVWMDMVPQIVIMVLSVSLGITICDLFLIRREARLAMKSILSAPEAKKFLDGWNQFNKLMNDVSHFWMRHEKEIKKDLGTIAEIIHQVAERRREIERKRMRYRKLRI